MLPYQSFGSGIVVWRDGFSSSIIDIVPNVIHVTVRGTGTPLVVSHKKSMRSKDNTRKMSKKALKKQQAREQKRLLSIVPISVTLSQKQ
jgi:hypothetical protein